MYTVTSLVIIIVKLTPTKLKTITDVKEVVFLNFLMQNNFGNIRVQIDLRPRSFYLSHRKPPPTHKQTPPPPNPNRHYSSL